MSNKQMIPITWTIRKFEELSTIELYRLLRLRQKIFVVEQNCAYVDCDNKDQNALHLLALHRSHFATELIAYLRVIIPENQKDVPHIGRVLCHPGFRKNGIGTKLIEKGISHCAALFPGRQIKISAQQHLVRFYTNLSFRVCSTPYDEDGIPHIEMVYENVPTFPTRNF